MTYTYTSVCDSCLFLWFSIWQSFEIFPTFIVIVGLSDIHTGTGMYFLPVDLWTVLILSPIVLVRLSSSSVLPVSDACPHGHGVDSDVLQQCRQQRWALLFVARGGPSSVFFVPPVCPVLLYALSMNLGPINGMLCLGSGKIIILPVGLFGYNVRQSGRVHYSEVSSRLMLSKICYMNSGWIYIYIYIWDEWKSPNRDSLGSF